MMEYAGSASPNTESVQKHSGFYGIYFMLLGGASAALLMRVGHLSKIGEPVLLRSENGDAFNGLGVLLFVVVVLLVVVCIRVYRLVSVCERSKHRDYIIGVLVLSTICFGISLAVVFMEAPGYGGETTVPHVVLAVALAVFGLPLAVMGLLGMPAAEGRPEFAYREEDPMESAIENTSRVLSDRFSRTYGDRCKIVKWNKAALYAEGGTRRVLCVDYDAQTLFEYVAIFDVGKTGGFELIGQWRDDIPIVQAQRELSLTPGIYREVFGVDGKLLPTKNRDG